MDTLDAHFVALTAKDGKVVFDIVMEDCQKGFAATGAPLVVNGKVIVGIAGGEYGIRGFIDAYDAASGSRAWRFYTVPAPGEKGSDTWQGDSWQHGGGPTWLSGTYDPDLNLLYWGVGNPRPDWDGDGAPGRQPFHRLAGRARRHNRRAALALPVHAARRARLGREPDSGARRSDNRRTAPEDRDGGQPERVLLCARSRDRRVHPRQPFHRHDLGERDRRGGEAAGVARTRRRLRRHGHMPGSLRRDEFHVAVVTTRPRSCSSSAHARRARRSFDGRRSSSRASGS